MSHYLQDWNEACAYAKECLPPPVYDISHEPWTFLLTIVFGVYVVWAWNERKKPNKI
jgi:hypothetical protein